jgi:hypothetical protein
MRRTDVPTGTFATPEKSGCARVRSGGKNHDLP